MKLLFFTFYAETKLIPRREGERTIETLGQQKDRKNRMAKYDHSVLTVPKQASLPLSGRKYENFTQGNWAPVPLPSYTSFDLGKSLNYGCFSYLIYKKGFRSSYRINWLFSHLNELNKSMSLNSDFRMSKALTY